MYLSGIRLADFRNYGALDLGFGSHLNVFVGENAQGKTNLLEAIYLLATGRSYRGASDSELTRWGQKGFAVRGVVERRLGKLVIEVGYRTEQRKRVKVNQTDLRKLSDLFGNLNTVVFSPEDLQLVKSSPAHRRRFLDVELAQVDAAYRRYLIDYQQVLLQRNNILKEARGGRLSAGNGELLAVWDDQLVDLGAKVLWKRLRAAARLADLTREAHGRITSGQEDLSFVYLAALGQGGKPLLSALENGRLPTEASRAATMESTDNVESFERGDPHSGRVVVDAATWDQAALKTRLAEGLAKSRPAELRRGLTLVGPHRDDFLLLVGGADLRAFGSQGQQRTAALALKLAELEFAAEEIGEYPVLLLDDVMSELDASRRRYLLEIAAPKVQLFVTTTGLHSFTPAQLAGGKVFTVRHGELTEAALGGEA